MLEIPEVNVLAGQINSTLKGKRIAGVIVAQTPHKFAFFSGDPQKYSEMLVGKTVEKAEPRGGLIVIYLQEMRLVFGDGANLRFGETGAIEPDKHQLLIRFSDSSYLVVTVQMYAGIFCFKEGTNDNPYYKIAGEKPGPLSSGFNQDYFSTLAVASNVQKLSLKALLATEQRIPGLGNGVLQDILFAASLHPKKKAGSLSGVEVNALFSSIKNTLSEMIKLGGRDTEKDLFGQEGKYLTRMSKNNLDNPCPRCGAKITKEAYLGGSIYYCGNCQKL
jgi:formamidopyrimidine-DNA glycosylase